jgi:hypothetical protein
MRERMDEYDHEVNIFYGGNIIIIIIIQYYY